MDLFSVAAGIALGAAFSPFWIMVWGMIKSKLTSPKQ
jgi:hypothetical protein